MRARLTRAITPSIGPVPGQELSRRFHAEVVHPVVVAVMGEQPYAAAMLGDGSDVLGHDDDVSPDHDFGPRVQVVVPPEVDPEPLMAALTRLPSSHAGYPVLYGSTSASSGWSAGPPSACTPAELFNARLGFDPGADISLGDWLTTPTQILATLTAGPVFYDPAGLLTERRAALRWYPDDLWRYVLAAAWLRIDQKSPSSAARERRVTTSVRGSSQLESSATRSSWRFWLNGDGRRTASG